MQRANMRAAVSMHRDIIIRKILLCLISLAATAQSFAVEIESPALLLVNVPSEISVTGVSPGALVRVTVADRNYQARGDEAGAAVFSEVTAGKRGLVVISASVDGGESVSKDLRVLPGWVSITPPLVAILIALTLRNVIPALLIGVWLGAAALRSFTPRAFFADFWMALRSMLCGPFQTLSMLPSSCSR